MNISRIARGRPRRHPRHKHLCTPLLCLLLAALLLVTLGLASLYGFKYGRVDESTAAGTITISVAEGYELVSVKISTLTGTYAFLNVEGVEGDISNTTTAVSGSSVVLNSVKNGSDGKQVRVTAIEVVYKAAAAN